MPGSASCRACTACRPACWCRSLAYFPFLYLPVAAQLRRLDPGARGRRRLARPSALARVLCAWCCRSCGWRVCGGALLVGLHLLAEYGLFVMIRFDTFTTAIVDQFQSTYNGPAANMLAGVLVLCCLVAARARGAGCAASERYARSAPAPPGCRGALRLGRARVAGSRRRRSRSRAAVARRAARHARRAGSRPAARESGASTRSVARSARPWRSPLAGARS